MKNNPIVIASVCVLLAVLAVIYFSPYHSCVRALEDDGSKPSDANLYCMRTR